jgi:hypothetical protein
MTDKSKSITDSQRARDEGVLIVTNILRRVATLERRRDFLRDELDKRREKGTSTEKAEGFVVAEIAALEGGIAALKFHHMVLGKDRSPFVALRELLDTVDELQIDLSAPPFKRLAKAVASGESVMDLAK